MIDYDKLIEKAPIIGIGKKIVHLSDFVNDVRFNTDKQFNKENALEDLNVLFDFINKYLEIEQELGIRLVTLLKALKNGIYTKKGFSSVEKTQICFGNFPTFIYSDCDNDGYLLSDYGKTWALTEEELEK